MCIVSERSKACLFYFMHLTVFNYCLLWQYFETDDPEFFKTKVCFILKNDVSEMDLVFAEEKYSKSGQLEKVKHTQPNDCVITSSSFKTPDKCFCLNLI